MVSGEAGLAQRLVRVAGRLETLDTPVLDGEDDRDRPRAVGPAGEAVRAPLADQDDPIPCGLDPLSRAPP
jgi:hypothetical protein